MNKSGIITNTKFTKQEAKIKRLVNEHGIQYGFPNDLEETVNAGISLGTGGGSADIFTAILDVDAFDIGRSAASARFAASFDGELVLPPEIAKALEFKIENKEKTRSSHIGLRGGEMTWGVLADKYYSRAVGVNIHGGANNVSFWNLRVQNFWRHYFDASKLTVTGYAFELGVDVIF